MRWLTCLKTRRRMRSRRMLDLSSRIALLSLLTAASAAHAGLGQARAVVLEDRSAIAARSMTTRSMPTYDRTEITTAEGTSVREFSARDGGVFAVDFSGPTMPDLKAVLGTHYDDYLAAARSQRGSHHVVSFATDDVVVTIVKAPRGFSGHAHLPAAVPAGVDVQTLR